MNGLLIDTNVLSELARPRPSRRVVTFLNEKSLDELYLCDVIIAEIRFGLEMTTDASRRGRFSTWLETFVRPNFAGRILALTEDVFLQWRLMREAGRKDRHTYPEPDLLIAATALHYHLTVITRDVTPFRRVNVPVINPWDGD